MRILRHFFVWWLPGLALLVVLSCALLFWLLSSQHGTRLLLRTAVHAFDGEVQGVQGTVLSGLRLQRLDIRVAGTQVAVDNLWLDVAWTELGHRRVHVRALTADRLSIDLPPPAISTDAEPASALPTSIRFPVAVAVDHLALGAVKVAQGGQRLPVSLVDIALSLQMRRDAALPAAMLTLHSLGVEHEAARLHLSGALTVDQWAAPWPLRAELDAQVTATGPASMICTGKTLDLAAGRAAPQHPEGVTAGVESLVQQANAQLAGCPISLQARAAGSLDQLDLFIDGAGAGLTLNGQAQLAPLAAFVLRQLRFDVKHDDGSGVSARLDWTPAADLDKPDDVNVELLANRVDVGRWLGNRLPPAVLSARAAMQARVLHLTELMQLRTELTILPESRWNQQPLSGQMQVELVNVPGAAALAPGLPDGWRLPRAEARLALGKNRISVQAQLPERAAQVKVDAEAPELAAFWPGLPGAAQAKVEVTGSLAHHRGRLDATYAPAGAQVKTLGRAAVRTQLEVDGAWMQADEQAAGWRGRIAHLLVQSADFAVEVPRPVNVFYVPQASTPTWQWEVGAAEIQAILPDRQRLTVFHGGSRGGDGRWETAGRADKLVLRASMLRQLLMAIDREDGQRVEREARRVNTALPGQHSPIVLDAVWDLKFSGSLAGRVQVIRREGDLRIPGDPAIPLGLKALQLTMTAVAREAGVSRINAVLNLDTETFGQISASVNTQLQGLTLAPRQVVRADIKADIADLAWLGLFVGDTLDIGGQLRASAQINGSLAGGWNARGEISGDKLRVVRIDDGVRLLDGTLRARLVGDRIILDSLRFPAVLRVMPDEWRTREWITTAADAKNGYVEAKGEWGLTDRHGQIALQLYRFPVLQRSDRYAMVSGQVTIDMALPRIGITGDLIADAGWVSLEILQGVPTLDDDVHLVRTGVEKSSATPMQLDLNLKFDMGPRFYITGMGLDAGLVGSIQVMMQGGRMTGVGALHTRAGGIEAYGQKLRLRRGSLTFQGRLDNPLLDIEALRMGEAVEAGVRVSGTAQRPRIDLVSYPDVSDVEKLSWLVLGRGPDAGGGDTALLLSIGTALLGGGQPLYKQFGLDDVSMRTGAIGSSGSILPDRTVASSVNRDADADLATQFLVASKRLANGITLSVEQAMAGSETVGRASYGLARGLSLDLKAGSVNGVELVYRWLIDD